jgi:hypothetical protein
MVEARDGRKGALKPMIDVSKKYTSLGNDSRRKLNIITHSLGWPFYNFSD